MKFEACQLYCTAQAAVLSRWLHRPQWWLPLVCLICHVSCPSFPKPWDARAAPDPAFDAEQSVESGSLEPFCQSEVNSL